MPYDEDNPNITVEYFKDEDWHSILSDVKSFTAKDGGVFTGSSASIKLNNKNGKYTSGATKIPVYSKVRILGDVRGVTDTIFEGRYQQYKGEYKDVKDNTVTLVCTGYEVLLDYYAKTENWMEQYPQYTYEEVIDRILATPDSFAETGVGTGITLETDSGSIKNKHALEQSSQESLSSIIREICERINYAGYMKNAGTKLVLKAVGTEPASPIVTLTDPFVFARPLFDITQVKNYAMPWDESEAGIPTDDRFTEKALVNYPNSWVATNPSECAVADSQTQFHTGHGQWSIKISKPADMSACVDAKLDMSKMYEAGYIDLTESRFTKLDVYFYPDRESVYGVSSPLIRYELVDTEDNRICSGPHTGSYRTLMQKYPRLKWSQSSSGIGLNAVIRGGVLPEWGSFIWGGWWYVTHNTDFNWKVKEFRIFDVIPVHSPSYDLYVDGLLFRGSRSIDPTIYHELIKKDQTSIDAYGHRTLPVSDSSLTSFVNAEALAQYNLDVLKTPIQKIEVKKGAKIWVKPSQTVMATVPSYEISGTRRVVEKTTEWKNKLLRTTFKVVPQFEPITRRTFSKDELAWLISRK